MLVPPPKKGVSDLQVVWAYPNTYEVGISSLGYQLIWRLLDLDPGTEVRRVFSDRRDRGWQAADLVGLTLSWELDFIHVLKILSDLGCEYLSDQRSLRSPLIFAGGPVLSANPEPFAAFFDVILLGDAEITIPALLQGWRDSAHLKSREERLRHLSTIEGLYVPSLYKIDYEEPCGSIRAISPVSNTVPSHPSRAVFMPEEDYVAHSVVLSPASTWGDMFLVEVARSCPQECRFCLASYLTRPFRSNKVDAIMQAIELALPYTKKIGLLGPSVTEHQNFSELAKRLLAKSDLTVTVPSIRMDTIEDGVLDLMVRMGQKSVTVAIESGSERLRSVMKKNLSEEQILRGVELIEAAGLESLKFYGIAGLPGEGKEDLDATISLLTKLKKSHKKLRYVFGLSSFVPKAQTPFQWSARPLDCQERMEYLRRPLAKIGIDVRMESHNWSDVQALLSRGDRRLTTLLISLAEQGSKLGAWKRALREHSRLVPGFDYYAFREIPKEEVLPWSHLMETRKVEMLKRHNDAAQTIANIQTLANI